MANTSLSKVFGTSTDEKKWTLSVWIKHSGTSGQEHIMFSNAGGNNNTGWFQIQISGNKLNLNGYSTTWLTSTQYLRDVSGWYHLVITADSTAAAANRLKAYINGQEITSWSTNNIGGSTSSNQTWGINMSGTNYIGAEGSGGANGFNGSMSYLNFIDGTVYLPSAFGETDTTTGEWVGKTSPSVTYGNNGFFIFKDSNGITDQSGKGNNWTVANGTLTILKDSPDNTFATFNPLDVNKGTVTTFSNGNTTVMHNAGANPSTTASRSTLAYSSGKFYWEAKCIATGGAVRTGIISMSSSDYNTQTNPFSLNECYNYVQNGQKGSSGDTNVSYGATYTAGDIIGIAHDADNGTLAFYKNGVSQGNAFTGLSTSLFWGAFSSEYNQGKYSYNFGNGNFGTTAITTNSGNGYSGAEGSSKFNYTVPSGYSALNTKGLNE